MQPKKRSLRRITALYIIFFVVIAISLVRTFASQFASDDFNTSWNDALRVASGDGRFYEILYDMPTATSRMDFDIPIFADEVSGISLKARPSVLDVKLESNNAAGVNTYSGSFFVYTLGMLCYAGIFVIIFIILGSLRKSIRKENLFHKSSIMLVRAIGILLIAASLIFSLVGYLEARSIAPYFAESGLQIYTSFPFDFTQLITGVLVFIIAEIFAIATSLSEEQKLTI